MSDPCECEQAGFECGARVYIGEPGKGYWACKKQLDAREADALEAMTDNPEPEQKPDGKIS